MYIDHLHAYTLTSTIAASEFAAIVDPITTSACAFLNTADELKENR